MLKDLRNLLWLIPLAAVLTLPLWKPIAADFLSPVRKQAPASEVSLTGPRITSSSEMTGVQFEQSQNGTREWLLNASRLFSAENDSDMQLEDVKALFFGAAGKAQETRISSQQARYNAETKKIALHGAVLIQNDEGYEMRTESLEYLAAEKKIRTTSAVNIQGNNIEVSGNLLLYDIVSGNYQLDGNVVCKIW